MTRDGMLILGVGNPLMGDDGAGIEAARLLDELQLPGNVTVMDAGTPGWGLVELIRDWPAVVIVDAMQMGLKPGEWKSFDARGVRLIASQGNVSLHDTDVTGGLALAQELDLLPEQVTLYGIEPESIRHGMSLSPAVRAGLVGLVKSLADKFAM